MELPTSSTSGSDLSFTSYLGEVRDRLSAAGVPGAAVGMSERGRVLLAEGLGFRDRDRELPATADTIFGLGSVTKIFTAVLVMKLQEEGRLRVEDPVVRFLPGFATPDPDHTRAVTLHHLLTHTSGLPPSNLLYRAMARTLSPDDEAYEAPIDTEAELLAALAAADMRYVGAPGERLSYSNEGFALLGFIVERAAGRSLPEYLRDSLLHPLGMERTSFRLPDVFDEPVTRMYRRAPDNGAAEPMAVWRNGPAMLAAGFLRSTVQDMLRFLEFFLSAGRAGETQLLSPASVEQMTRPHAPYAPRQAYGYGVRITEGYRGGRLLEHSGGLLGVASHFTMVPDRDLAAVGLANLTDAPLARLTLAAVNARLGLGFDEPRVTYPDRASDDEPRHPFLEGEYATGERDVLRVRDENGRLAIGVDAPVPARYLGGAGYLAEAPGQEPQYHRFLLDERGRAWGVTLGTRVLFRRTP